eukprot:169474_1
MIVSLLLLIQMFLVLPCAKLISTFISNMSIHQQSLTVLVLRFLIECDKSNSFTANSAQYLFEYIHQRYSCNYTIDIIYKLLNLAAMELSSDSPIPFSPCIHTWISKKVIRNLKSLLIYDKSAKIRLRSAKLLLNINNCLHQCHGTGSDHLKTIWIANLIINDMVHTIQSL